jgi:hypothetical protein
MEKENWSRKKNRPQRVAWCEQRVHFSKDNWCNVIFSDKSIFYVLECKNQVKIWKTDEERLYYDCIQHMSTDNHGKIGI